MLKHFGLPHKKHENPSACKMWWRLDRAKNPPSPPFRFSLSVSLNSEVKFWLGTTDFRNMQILEKALSLLRGTSVDVFARFEIKNGDGAVSRGLVQ